jgi:hypothetical protein
MTAFCVAKGETLGAETYLLLYAHNTIGQLFGLIQRLPKNMDGKPFSGFLTYAGQLG